MRDMLPLSQKELALRIGIAPSSLSRAIKYRTIETPQSREVTLKSFFPGPKNFKMVLLKKVIETEMGLSSDIQIQSKLAEKYGVNISRRSVVNLRNELKISPRSSTGR
jgi:DNA-directed RNA polymerase specialized sigma54-like protein